MPGVTVPVSGWRFLRFPRIEGGTDSFAFSKRLLEETRAGLAPGVAFGAGGEGAARICDVAERSILEPQWNSRDAFCGGEKPAHGLSVITLDSTRNFL
jgi:aspartate/methionine/tyrosine aminotransferase